jgi:nucleoside-diphosphate kinase
MEQTLVLIKPDAVNRGLIGEIIMRIERKGLAIVGAKMLYLTGDLIAKHYQHLSDKAFFPELRKFMQSAPLIALCVEGLDAIETMRKLAGITLARQAEPGTIRGDFAMSVQCNLILASDSPQTAKEELARFFKSEEVFSFERAMTPLVYAAKERI